MVAQVRHPGIGAVHVNTVQQSKSGIAFIRQTANGKNATLITKIIFGVTYQN